MSLILQCKNKIKSTPFSSSLIQIQNLHLTIAGIRRTMATTFTLEKHGLAVPVSLPNNLNKHQLIAFSPFDSWLQTLSASLSKQQSDKAHPFHACPYELHNIEIQAVDWFGNRVGFIKLQAKIENDKKEWIPGAVFLRGPSVAMLLVLTPEDASEDEKYAVLTVQPRVAAGSLSFVELPAGMLDGGTFAGTASKEIKEETGIEVSEDELINMSELALGSSASPKGTEAKGELGNGIYPSPGACDEHIPLFLCNKTVSRKDLEEWQGRLTGLRDEGEKITLKLVPLKDVWKEAGRDAKTLAAIFLHEKLLANNLLK
jgi:ADP-sugar diphosphatase